MKNNYKDYDTLNLYVKEDKLQEIIEHYQVFGWTLIQEKENKTYADLVDLTFMRPHKIANKDELQLQQIYMEERLNELGKLKKTKHARTTSFGLCFGIILVALISVGALVAIQSNSIWGKVLGVVIAGLGLVLIFFELKLLKKMYNHEKRFFEQRATELEVQIVRILNHVKQLTGGDYGQE